MKAAMISSQKTLDEKITESSLSIFADSKAITSKQFQELRYTFQNILLVIYQFSFTALHYIGIAIT